VIKECNKQLVQALTFDSELIQQAFTDAIIFTSYDTCSLAVSLSFVVDKNDMSDKPRIMLVTGEVSGDRQGAFLASEIQACNGAVTLFGAGGDQMRATGVDIRVQTSHLGSVGFVESVPYIRPMRKVLKELTQAVDSMRPHAVVLIDNEVFNTAFARKLHRKGVPVIFYFAPQVWMWGTFRARSIAKIASMVITLLRPEDAVYRRYGARSAYVGYPLLDIVKPDSDPSPAFEKANLDMSRPTIALLPASRLQEIRNLAPRMFAAARRVRDRHPDVQFVLPVAVDHWRTMLDDCLRESGLRDSVSVIENMNYTILSQCKAAMVKSGTTTMEMAILGIPMVVTYRVRALSSWLIKRLVTVSFAAMPNILSGRRIVPELLQGEASAENLAHQTLRILEDEAYAEAMRGDLRQLRESLGEDGAIRRAARLILGTVSPHTHTKLP
jgi:lipid-A-disaccharide synthase